MIPLHTQGATNSKMPGGKETPQYKTLFKDKDKLADLLGDLDGVALRLADKLFEMKVIEKSVRDAADARGPDVTETMRVDPVIKAVLAQVDLNSEMYEEFRVALLSGAVGVLPDIVNKCVPKGMLFYTAIKIVDVVVLLCAYSLTQ